MSLPTLLAAVLLAGYAYASWQDWRTREVGDRVWQLLGGVGLVGGLFAFATGSLLGVLLWVLAAAFVLEHMVPWDVAVERRSKSLPGALELGAYVGVLAVLAFSLYRYGIGPGEVPVAVVAVVVTVVLARGLFEIGLLYGGADAKALMVGGLLVPMFALPLLPVPATAQQILAYYPFALNVLMNAAVLSIAVPVALALRNLRSGSFEFPRGFTSYLLPVSRLSQSFVWLKDPLTNPDGEDPETTEEDAALRARQQAGLEAKGVREVWVTPQLPFVILLALGAATALLWGNLVIDLAALL